MLTPLHLTRSIKVAGGDIPAARVATLAISLCFWNGRGRKNPSSAVRSLISGCYFKMFSQKRCRMAATSARVALPFGIS